MLAIARDLKVGTGTVQRIKREQEERPALSAAPPRKAALIKRRRWPSFLVDGCAAWLSALYAAPGGILCKLPLRLVKDHAIKSTDQMRSALAGPSSLASYNSRKLNRSKGRTFTPLFLAFGGGYDIKDSLDLLLVTGFPLAIVWYQPDRLRKVTILHRGSSDL
jgi:hypothetical protein